MEISEQQVKEFIEANHFAIFSTVNKNGTPNAAPIYYAQDHDGSFIFICPEKTQKALNIDHQNEIVLTITNEEQNITTEIRGTAHKDSKRLKEAIRLISRKLGSKEEVVDTLPLLKFKDQSKTVVVIKPKTIIYRMYLKNELAEKVLSF